MDASESGLLSDRVTVLEQIDSPDIWRDLTQPGLLGVSDITLRYWPELWSTSVDPDLASIVHCVSLKMTNLFQCFNSYLSILNALWCYPCFALCREKLAIVCKILK